MIGPVQVLVVGFDHATFSGEVVAELSSLQKAGIVRLVGLLLVSRAEDGTLETVTDENIPAHLRRLATGVLAAENGDAPLANPDQLEASTWSLADAIPHGRTAAIALIEHTWASPLRDALIRNGGRPLDETWLAPDDLDRLEQLITDSGS